MHNKTAKILQEMIDHANAGHEIIPMFFQPMRGRSNYVSAAIRFALKNNLLEPAGVDGVGRPKYRAVEIRTIHTASESIN